MIKKKRAFHLQSYQKSFIHQRLSGHVAPAADLAQHSQHLQNANCSLQKELSIFEYLGDERRDNGGQQIVPEEHFRAAEERQVEREKREFHSMKQHPVKGAAVVCIQNCFFRRVSQLDVEQLF